MTVKRCEECEHKKVCRDMEYYNYPYCDINGREISYGAQNGYVKMKWCPLEGKNDGEQ